MKKKLREILLVDDSAATNTLNKRAIEGIGIAEKVTIAINGMEALEYLSSKNKDGNYPRPNIVFLDIDMPVMDGFQFLDRYCSLCESIRQETMIVMLTTSMNDNDRLKTEEYIDVKGYLYKPLKEDDLLKIARPLLTKV